MYRDAPPVAFVAPGAHRVTRLTLRFIQMPFDLLNSFPNRRIIGQLGIE